MEKININAETENSNVFKRLWNKVVDNVAADKKVDDGHGLSEKEKQEIYHLQAERTPYTPLGDKGIER